MQEFIVTGQIPGTNITLTFDGVLSIICALVGMILLHSVVKHVRAQQPDAEHNKSDKKPVFSSEAKPSTAFQPSGAEPSIN